MKTGTKFSPAAAAYARALLELANERGQAEAVNGELQALREALDADPRFAAFLRDPGIDEQQKLAVIRRALEGRASQLVVNFLGVMARKDRLGLLVEATTAFDELLSEQLGKIEVDVTVAQKLTPDQLEQIRQRVSRALGKDAVVHPYVDESIIGGLILRVQDRLIDGSVRAQLEAMRVRLISARQAKA